MKPSMLCNKTHKPFFAQAHLTPMPSMLNPHLLKLRLSFSLLLLFLLVAVSACERKPADLIPEDVYVNLLVEFEIINFLYGSEADSLAQREFLNLVFRSYNISPEQFDRSHAWYERDVEAQIQRKRLAVDRMNQTYGRIHNTIRENEP